MEIDQQQILEQRSIGIRIQGTIGFRSIAGYLNYPFMIDVPVIRMGHASSQCVPEVYYPRSLLSIADHIADQLVTIPPLHALIGHKRAFSCLYPVVIKGILHPGQHRACQKNPRTKWWRKQLGKPSKWTMVFQRGYEKRTEDRSTYYTWKSGWWFGTVFMFPYIGNNHPN